MTLQEQLTSLKEQNLAKFSDEVRKTILDDFEKLSKSGLVEAAPKVGDKLKDFVLGNHLEKKVSLNSIRENGPVVITFYRGGWCPYCNMELSAYQAVLPEIKKAGATLVAITPELPDESLSTSERHRLDFEVLTDRNSEYAQEIGIAFTIQEEVRPIYESFGIDVEKHNGEGQFIVPLATTFIVDKDGSIVYSFVDSDYTRRADPIEIVEKLRSL